MPREVSWLPETALNRMQADLIAHNDLTRAQLADRVIEDAAPLAAYSIVDMATNSEDEGVRLRAAQYVLDRANGKPKTTLTVNSNPQDPILKLIDGVIVERGVAAVPDTYADYTQTATVIDQSRFAPPIRHTDEDPDPDAEPPAE
jgi:hypothetical protein